ncbi:hypothetical protein CDL15_Pgr028115 [Punica granatum]|uniref:RNA-binding protein NOB1 n=1 Tax=Punica granatum TaxID=22663 RepID=A0A218XKI1_PUNGR|nr:hypothetical protein CDL15_Pgr028115 [Punica granatum]
MDEAPAQPPVPPASCWSNVVKSQPPAKPKDQNGGASAEKIFVESCKSSKGVAVAVIDANAIIEGGDRLSGLADRFVSIPEVMEEVRDPVSRRRLDFVPFTVDTMEPSPESLSKVIKFAKATGDLQTLSEVDIKLIALTYTLEAQIHGTKHLRDCPPPVQTVNVRRLPEKEMPGWGSNVPNLEEWEALEHEAGVGSNLNSRILPLKDLNLNVIPQDEHSLDGSAGAVDGENQEDVEGNVRKPRRYPPQKKEVNIEGKKMVADGIDASQGQFEANAGDWMPAVSRSTHRRYLRRKGRREYYDALSEKESQQDAEKDAENHQFEAPGYPEGQVSESPKEVNSADGISEESAKDTSCNNDLSSVLKQMRLEEESLPALQEGEDPSAPSLSDNATSGVDGDEADALVEQSEYLENLSQTNGSVDVSLLDDESSEQSWMLRSLSESSVACVTSDFAMQNVILQMGLRLVAPGGMQIHQLHRWILKCHACYTVTGEIGRIFCPKCGNGGTLRKVAVTVNENGIVMAAHQPRIRLRGTKFSLPLPQGGRDAITKNLILREDQLPQKYLYPKTKKKAHKKGDDDFFSSDDIFLHHTDKRAPFQPPVRRALAVFSGKRNPNDNHFSRSKRK